MAIKYSQLEAGTAPGSNCGPTPCAPGFACFPAGFVCADEHCVPDECCQIANAGVLVVTFLAAVVAALVLIFGCIYLTIRAEASDTTLAQVGYTLFIVFLSLAGAWGGAALGFERILNKSFEAVLHDIDRCCDGPCPFGGDYEEEVVECTYGFLNVAVQLQSWAVLTWVLVGFIFIVLLFAADFKTVV